MNNDKLEALRVEAQNLVKDIEIYLRRSEQRFLLNTDKQSLDRKIFDVEQALIEVRLSGEEVDQLINAGL